MGSSFYISLLLYSIELELLAQVAEQKRKDINVRQKRPYMIADAINLECDNDGDTGMLAVSEFLKFED